MGSEARGSHLRLRPLRRSSDAPLARRKCLEKSSCLRQSTGRVIRDREDGRYYLRDRFDPSLCARYVGSSQARSWGPHDRPDLGLEARLAPEGEHELVPGLDHQHLAGHVQRRLPAET